VGDHEAEASSQVGLGMVLTILGEHAEARRCLDAGLRFAEDTANDRGQASTLLQLAKLELMRGDLAAAVKLYRRSIDVASRIGDDEILCWSHCRLGEALRLLDQHDEALLNLHQCQFHAQRIGDGSAHASSLAQIAAVYRDREDYPTAVGYCEQAMGIVDSMAIPDLAITTQISTVLAEVNLARGDTELATSNAMHAVVLARRTRSASAEADACTALGDSHFAAGEPREATVAWRHAAQLFEHTGNLAKAALVQAKIAKAPSSVNLPETRSSHPSPDRSTSDTPQGHSASA
jgi:tetratricopeptide (TPR) repeat protein